MHGYQPSLLTLGQLLLVDASLASLGLGRLAHKAHVLVITGTSFRAQGRRYLEQEAQIETSVPSR
jgi:fatty acid-binding protein DegV